MADENPAQQWLQYHLEKGLITQPRKSYFKLVLPKGHTVTAKTLLGLVKYLNKDERAKLRDEYIQAPNKEHPSWHTRTSTPMTSSH